MENQVKRWKERYLLWIDTPVELSEESYSRNEIVITVAWLSLTSVVWRQWGDMHSKALPWVSIKIIYNAIRFLKHKQSIRIHRKAEPDMKPLKGFMHVVKHKKSFEIYSQFETILRFRITRWNPRKSFLNILDRYSQGLCATLQNPKRISGFFVIASCNTMKFSIFSVDFLVLCETHRAIYQIFRGAVVRISWYYMRPKTVSNSLQVSKSMLCSTKDRFLCV